MRPIVGRDQESALLLERWRQAEAGEGQMVLLTGEAGIGKSRIAEALIAALESRLHLNLRYQCSPYHTDSALWPTTRKLAFAAGIVPDDPAETHLDKLEALLVPIGAQVALRASQRHVSSIVAAMLTKVETLLRNGDVFRRADNGRVSIPKKMGGWWNCARVSKATRTATRCSSTSRLAVN